MIPIECEIEKGRRFGSETIKCWNLERRDWRDLPGVDRSKLPESSGSSKLKV